MKTSTVPNSRRWLYLAVGVIALLFAGIIYAWSILKAPLAAEFGWPGPDLAFNFTLTMCFFCLGGPAGGLLAKRFGTFPTLTASGVLSCAGFVLASHLTQRGLTALYLSYGVLAALGIGMAYNVIISTVSLWFPDRKGLCSGMLMMGFGASALVVGALADFLFLVPGMGWRKTYVLLGLGLGAALLLTGAVLRLPGSDPALPQAGIKSADAGEAPAPRSYTPAEMLRRGAFWRAFLCIVFLAAVGNTAISFARDLALSVGAGAGLATALVGGLSVCNGLGRILTGGVFDRLGRRPTMLLFNGVSIAAALVTLLSIILHAVPLCVLGLCLIGISYGSCPTISSAFISSFYGPEYFSINFSLMNFNLMGAALIAMAANLLLSDTGGYLLPFAMLCLLAAAALGLNCSIRQP